MLIAIIWLGDWSIENKNLVEDLKVPFSERVKRSMNALFAMQSV